MTELELVKMIRYSDLRKVTLALLDPVNCYGTMLEFSCDEAKLYEHPEWLFFHYSAYGGELNLVGPSKSAEAEKPDLDGYKRLQIVKIFGSLLNIDTTRRRFGCNNRELIKDPSLLVTNFIENGGAADFAEKNREIFGLS